MNAEHVKTILTACPELQANRLNPTGCPYCGTPFFCYEPASGDYVCGSGCTEEQVLQGAREWVKRRQIAQGYEEVDRKNEPVNGFTAQVRVTKKVTHKNGNPNSDTDSPLSVGVSVSEFPLIDFEQLCGLPPPKFQVEDFFLEESIIQGYGETNVGKSLLFFDLACTICKGAETWFGRRILKHGPVVWINADGGRGLTLRAKAWREANGHEMQYPLLTLMGSVHLHQAQQIGRFRQQILNMDEQPVLIVFDTQSRCTPGVKENDADAMTLMMEGLHRLKADAGCSNVLVHHANVSAERERGSGVPKNECDTQIRVKKDLASGIFTVECTKGRDHPEFKPFFFKVQPVLDSVVIVQHDSAPPKRPGDAKIDRQHELVQLVLERPGITYEEAASELNTSEKTIRRDAEALDKVISRVELANSDNRPGPPRVGMYAKSGTTDRRLGDE